MGPLCASLLSVLVGLVSSHLPATGQVQPQPNEPEPQFLAALENMTASQGRDVQFTCIVDHLGPYRVAWIKSDTKAILAIHTHLVAHNQRLSVTHNGHNTWRLHVNNVQPSDNGTYMCQINTEPMRSQMGSLSVVVPPDILSNDSSETSGVAREGGSVMLRCTAVGVPEPTVSWRREDTANIVFRHDGGREKQAVRSVAGPVLQLAGVMRQDMGTYLCIATNGVPPAVSKRYQVQVHFEPLIKVSNQLVAAPAYSDVIIQCYVEASPKAMNTWWRESATMAAGGAHEMDKLVQGDKYIMQEIQLSDYAVLMNLTIRGLAKHDFGGYVCSSVNVLGKSEGNIRLQELHLPATPSTTTSTSPPRHSHEPGKHRGRNKSTNANKTPAHSKDTQAKQQQQARKKAQQLEDGAAGSSTEQHGDGDGPGTVTAPHWDASTKSPPRRRDRWNDIPGAGATSQHAGVTLLAAGLVGVLAGRR